jgi:CMP-N,N'-diacetyllegionaminic acid synthase
VYLGGKLLDVVMMLIVIPARGGSKGIPRKNVRLLGGKPLIGYSIELALGLTTPAHICVSTDDEEIAAVAKSYGVPVPFRRPAHLASDMAGTYEVLLHALEYYRVQGHCYTEVLLLQPTSPFRRLEQVQEAIALYEPSVDMVVSVVESANNPYYNLFEEGTEGFLHVSKLGGGYTRRQDCPKVYAYNGSIYVIGVASLERGALHTFERVRKYVMPAEYSIDLDTLHDWQYAEWLLEAGLIGGV